MCVFLCTTKVNRTYWGFYIIIFLELMYLLMFWRNGGKRICHKIPNTFQNCFCMNLFVLHFLVLTMDFRLGCVCIFRILFPSFLYFNFLLKSISEHGYGWGQIAMDFNRLNNFHSKINRIVEFVSFIFIIKSFILKV